MYIFWFLIPSLYTYNFCKCIIFLKHSRGIVFYAKRSVFVFSESWKKENNADFKYFINPKNPFKYLINSSNCTLIDNLTV